MFPDSLFDHRGPAFGDLGILPSLVDEYLHAAGPAKLFDFLAGLGRLLESIRQAQQDRLGVSRPEERDPHR